MEIGSGLLALCIGYLCGSIPFGLILTRLAGLGDVRKIGSGNIGATNVLRTGNRLLAAITLLLDAAKGSAGVLLGALFHPAGAFFAGFGAFMGHCFPAWLGFRGGKGVATYIGVIAAIAWPYALAFLAIWIGIAAIFRVSSLSALIATASTSGLFWIFGALQEALLATILTVICWAKHHENISRLVAGTESRIGSRN